MQSSSSDTNNNIIIFSRYKYIAGDFFKSIPSGADGYIIKNVILNWDDESVSIILKNCLQAMEFSIKNYQKDNGRQKVKPKLIIIDAVMPEDDGPSIGNLLDIMMLVLTMNGRIRNKREYIKLLKSCGFEVANIIHPPSSSFSPSPMNFLTIIEAIPHSIDNRL